MLRTTKKEEDLLVAVVFDDAEMLDGCIYRMPWHKATHLEILVQ